MATETTLSVTCDRRKRVETRPLPEKHPATDREAPAFSAAFREHGGSPQNYAIVDLCEPCGRTVQNLLSQIMKKVEKKSPDRKAAKKS